MIGEKAVCFGDSITWYDGHPYNWGKEAGIKARGYESYLRDAGMYVRNEGISDATILQILQKVYSTALNDYDYVFVTSGANDSRYNIPTGVLKQQGSSFETDTFMGCLQEIIEYVHGKNPSAKIVLMTPIKGWIYAPLGYAYGRAEDGEVEERFAEAIIQAGNYYGCTVCDWYHKSGIELKTRTWMINDPEPIKSAKPNPNPFYSLHPSSEGYRRMADVLLQTIGW